jgi:acyl carrier protein
MSDASENQISLLIAETLGLEPEAVGAEATMDTLPAWDSLQHLGVVMAIESRYGCRLSPEEVSELTSVARIAAYLRGPEREP